MALQVSGPISASQIRTELAGSGPLSLDAVGPRGLAGKPSGIIKYSDFYGKSSITPGQTFLKLNLRKWAVEHGWDQVSPYSFTLPAGCTIWSDDTAVAALTIDGSWPGGVTFINEGWVMGMGGKGGGHLGTFGVASPTASTDPIGKNGGHGISLGAACTIINRSGAYIAGGGGGGGAGVGLGTYGILVAPGGGGAGGGYAGDFYGFTTNSNGTLNKSLTLPGVAGGAIGQLGTDAPAISIVVTPSVSFPVVTGAAGGRIFPGTGGQGGIGGLGIPANLAKGGGAGGGGGYGLRGDWTPQGVKYMAYNSGGGGGGWGASGGSGYVIRSGYISQTSQRGGNGGASNSNGENGAAYSIYDMLSAGGAGGKGIALNGYTCNFSDSGTTWGAVS